MEKKKLIRIIAIAAACVIAIVAAIVIPVSVVNCNNEDTPSGKPNDGNDPDHEHSYGKWIYDENNHWQLCTGENCGDPAGTKYNLAPHNTNGENNSCTVCGYEPPHVQEHEHIYSDWIYDNQTHWKICTGANCGDPAGTKYFEATHNTDGEKNSCTVCGFEPPLSNISELVDLSQIGEGETAYCAATFKSKVYEGEGVYSETETTDYYIVGAYSENAPTKFYLFDGKNKLGYVTAYYTSNTVKIPFKGNKGGIATNGLCMWIAYDSRVYCITYWSHPDYTNVCDKIIQTAADGGEIEITDTFNPNCRADFVYYRENPSGATDSEKYQLFVGENHKEQEIDSTHKITYNYKDNDGNITDTYVTNAYIVKYVPYVSNEIAIGSLTGLQQTKGIPSVERIYALGDDITGFAVTDTDLILSDGENLYYYDWSKIDASANRNSFKSLKGADFEAYTSTGETVTMIGVYVYYIRPDFLIKDYESEGKVKDIIVKDDTFYLM